MDYSTDFHRQLVQLEDQLLVGAGIEHAWTSNDNLSSDCDSEPHFLFRDLNTQFPSIATDRFSSLQCSSHGDRQKIAEILEEEEEASVSVDETKGTTTCRLTKRLGLGHEAQMKRPCILKQQKPAEATPNRARAEPRSSCPPLKIRKEKLGDRIAALQQLVAPFGKTDTASVLMEAINYIKFLENQVEMLTHSYVKSHRTRNHKTMGRSELEEEAERDLKGMGLSLLPLALISELAEDNGVIWPPLVNFSRRIF